VGERSLGARTIEHSAGGTAFANRVDRHRRAPGVGIGPPLLRKSTWSVLEAPWTRRRRCGARAPRANPHQRAKQMTDMPMTDVDREELDLLLRGFQVSRMLRLIAAPAIADKIPTDGRATAQELAAACAVQPEPLLRVLRALAAFRIFQVTTDGVVAHTP